LTPPPPPSGPGGPATLKAEEHIFENCLQNKRCSAGCKLTRAVLGTSAYICKFIEKMANLNIDCFCKYGHNTGLPFLGQSFVILMFF